MEVDVVQICNTVGSFDCVKSQYLLIDLEQEALIFDLTDEEEQGIASKRILKQY